MQLFYQPDISEKDQQVIFSREESKHIVKVLRKKESDILHITNGKGLLFETEILSAGTNKCIAGILSFTITDPAPYHLHLAVAPTKMNDRFELFLEKATEIGIQEITPVICEHSERKVVKMERYERVLQSALKQSLHTYLPKLNEPISFSKFIEKQEAEQKFIAHCEEASEKKFLFKEVKKDSSVVVLIGPEGDFSPEEISKAIETEWQPVSLGNSRLRTETAAIVACHTVALVNEE